MLDIAIVLDVCRSALLSFVQHWFLDTPLCHLAVRRGLFCFERALLWENLISVLFRKLTWTPFINVCGQLLVLCCNVAMLIEDTGPCCCMYGFHSLVVRL